MSTIICDPKGSHIQRYFTNSKSFVLHSEFINRTMVNSKAEQNLYRKILRGYVSLVTAMDLTQSDSHRNLKSARVTQPQLTA